MPNAAHAAPKPSTARAPATDAIGPAATDAIGPAATNAAGPIALAPTRLNDPTRDSAAAGTRRWVTVEAVAPAGRTRRRCRP